MDELFGQWTRSDAPVTGTLAAVAAANLGLIILEVVGTRERPVTVPSTAIAAVEH